MANREGTGADRPTLGEIVSGLASDPFERGKNPPDESLVQRCFARQEVVGSLLDTGQHPPPRMVCDSCGGRVYELLLLARHFGICTKCREAVWQAHDLRHAGEYTGPWRRSREKKPDRLSDPPTPQQALQVYRRDEFTCQYCGEVGGDLTVDHIDPEGGNSLDNFATACRSCNSRKGRRTPEEAGMEVGG